MNEPQASRTLALLAAQTGCSDLPRLLAPGRVGLVLAGADAVSPQAQLAFTFALNLLARLYPAVQILEIAAAPVPLSVRLPRWSAVSVREHAQRFMQRLQPPLRHWSLVDTPSASAECLVVGSDRVRHSAVYLASDGWQVWLSPSEPPSRGVRLNPIGAYCAACLGVAEIWKRLCLRHRELFRGVPIALQQDTLSLSTYTLSRDPEAPNPDLPDLVDLRRLTMVGLGAGGAAAAYSLASLPALAGTVTLVEPDLLTDTNLNRYCAADRHDVAGPKTAVMASILRSHPRLMTRLVQMPFEEACAQRDLDATDYEWVLAGVDSAEARRHIQYETPKVLWDMAAAADGEVRVWRMALGETECMLCKHPRDDDPERRTAERIAAAIGLDPDLVHRKMASNGLFTQAEVDRIRLARSGEPDTLRLPHVGEPFSDWRMDHCGRHQFAGQEEGVPIPFAPVLAGVIAAGEVLKEHLFPDAVLRSRLMTSVLGRPFASCRAIEFRPPHRGCRLCTDQAMLNQYRRRWPHA